MRVVGLGDDVFDCDLGGGVAYPGGNAANGAVSAARLGEDAAFAGVIAGDAWGEVMRASLRCEGVDLSLCEEAPAATTKLVLQEPAGGARAFAGVDEGGAWRPMPPLEGARLSALEDADVILTGCNAKSAPLLASLDGRRGLLSFDCGEKDKYRTRAYLGMVVPHADLVQFSCAGADDGEVGRLLGSYPFFEQGSCVLVTRGTEAPVLATPDGRRVLGRPASGAPAAADALGAGDAFACALMIALRRQGWRRGGALPDDGAIEDALASAAAHAARMCGERGSFGHPWRWRRRVEAVVFDMDGVLVESEPFYCQQIRDFLALHGKELSDEQADQLYGSSDAFQERLIADELGWDLERASAAHAAYYAEHPVDYGAVRVPGARELMAWLHGRGIKVGVASSSPMADVRRALEECGMDCYVGAVASGYDECAHAKPDPEVYRLALARLGVGPQEALAIEDSSYGIQAGVAAGVDVLCLRKPHGAIDRSGALLEFDSHEQIGAYLEAVLEPPERPDGARDPASREAPAPA